MKFLSLALLLALSACAVDKKSILLDVEPATPLDERDLFKHCDLGDPAACTLAHPNRAPGAGKFPILQGLAVPERAVFAALVPKDSHLDWFLYDRLESKLTKLNVPLPKSRPHASLAVQRVEARGLEPGHEYELLASNHEGQIVDDRQFRSLSDTDHKLRLALVGGLARLSPTARAEVLRRAAESNPDLLVFVGGNVNTELPKKFKGGRPEALDHYFARQAETRAREAFTLEPRLWPVAAIWNETEIGAANADRSFAFVDPAREMFELFFPEWPDEILIVDGPGVSKLLHISEHEVAFLDNRSFRTPPPVAPAPECTGKGKKRVCHREPAPEPAPGWHYGTLQMEWMLRQAGKAQAPLYLVTGDPWAGSYTENWFDVAVNPLPSLAFLRQGGAALLELHGEAPAEVKPLTGNLR